MNKNRYNLPALLTSLAMILIFALGIAYCFYDYHFVDFAVVSTDPEAITINGLITSFLCFFALSICFYLCYKNRFKKTSILLGIVNIIAFFTFCIFLPTGYSIFGFFFDFPAVFVDSEFYFFENEITLGLDRLIGYENLPILTYILNLIEILLVSLFLISPIVNGVISVKMGIDIHTNTFYKKEKHYKRFSVILMTLTFVCLFTMTMEISADFIKSLIMQHS